MSARGVLRSSGGLGLVALVEIVGVWFVWHGTREAYRPLWLAAGLVLLATYGVLIPLRGSRRFGAALVAHGAVLVVGALVWAAVVDGMRPDRWDVTGAAICLLGMAVIVHGRRRTG